MCSLPSEEIWALVCGLPSRLRSTALLGMIRVFADDSEINRPPVYVLAGWIATAEKWAAFSDDWDKVLFMSPRIEYFKYAEAMNFNGQFFGISRESRDEKLSLLVGVIEDHDLLGVASIIPDSVFQGLFGKRVIGPLRNPYLSMVHALMYRTINHFISLGVHDKIDFVFDVQPGQSGKVVESWEIFLKVCPPEYKTYLSGLPSFQDDKRVLPLQAADLHAGWVREINTAEMRGQPIPIPPWGRRGENLTRINHVWTAELAEDLFEKLAGYRPTRVSYTFD